MQEIKKQWGAIGIGVATLIVTALGLVAAGTWTITTWVPQVVNESIKPVQAEIIPLQNDDTLLKEQTAVIGANLFLLCQSNEQTKGKCQSLPQ